MDALAIDRENSVLETAQPVLADDASPVTPSVSRADFLTEMLRQQQGLASPRGDDLALTAAEAFSSFHDGHDERFQLRQSRYRELMPASPPQPEQQYAFEVDLDRCSGCKACVTACHSLNGLDENETWRDVGLLIGGTSTLPVMQHVTAACHHCLEPACLAACPVNAYEKDPLTGIVKHLDDQCFGCQYCTLACPYDVPKYHAAKGIVRKCDMCSSRLAVGEAPACVQACPHQAISIKVIDVRQMIEDTEAANFLPAAPDPHITLPTTTYRTARPFPRNLLPADYFRVDRQHTHWPLVVMLVLTQLSVGAFIVGQILDAALEARLVTAVRPLLAANALGFGLLALVASVFHLGRPQYAFRAVLGLAHSWLSREIVGFGIFTALASVYAASIFLVPKFGESVTGWLGWAVAAAGGVAVFCSVMIYVFTQRECWSFARVAVRFLLTSALLGVAALWLTILVLSLVRPSAELKDLVGSCGTSLCAALIVVAAAKLLWEAAALRHLPQRRMTAMKRSALLMIGELSNFTLARFAVGVLGGLVMPAFLLLSLSSGEQNLPQFVVVTSMLFIASLVGELLERALFFTACAAPKMPGGIR
jgi:formate dehydrogenase iron-sulfur subunit